MGEKKIRLTGKQQLFINEYVKDLNAYQAAIRAGYSKKSAGESGCENLKNSNIRKIVDDILKEKCISADETVKLISDIAKSSINDYLILTVREQKKKVRKGLKEIIQELKNKINMESTIAMRIDMSAERAERFAMEQMQREEDLVRLEVELEMNPKAYRIVYSDPILVESAELDLAKLAKDKENGRIKSIAWTEFGPKVELYAADAALTNMAKIHGKFEKDNEQKQPVIKVGFQNTDDE